MDQRTRQSLPAWTMLGAALLATTVASLEVKQAIENDAIKRFALACDQITLKLDERLHAYGLVLRGGSGLLVASGKVVDRTQWRNYVATLRVNENVRGVQAIGFAPAIAADELAAHIARTRREGFGGYTVWPPGKRALYAPVLYAEPFVGSNQLALGFDTFSEAARRSAMEKARDSGDVELSGRVELIGETARDRQWGTVMYAPVYRDGAAVDTLEQRRAALIGWVFSPHRMNDLIHGVLGEGAGKEALALKIYDGENAAPDKLLFASPPASSAAGAALPHQLRTIKFDGTSWLLEFDGSAAGAAVSYVAAWSVLAGGLLVSALVFGLMSSAINTRANAARIAARLTDEIRSHEDLLKESEFRWKFAIEGSGFALWDWNVVSGAVFFSNQWKTILGHAKEESFEHYDDWQTRLHPDDRAATLSTLQEHLDGKASAYVNEHRLRRKDGSYIWVLSHGLVVSRSNDGKPLRMIGTTMDISERKRTEEALREQKEFFHLIAENIGDFIAVLDTSGRRLYNSPSYRQFFSTDTNLHGSDSFAQVHPRDRERVIRAFRETVSSGIGRQIDYGFIRSDGSVREMESVGSVIKDSAGAVARVVVVSHDVTERRQAERALRESEAFKDSILNSVPAEIAVVDHNGMILAVNEQWSRFARANGVGGGLEARLEVGSNYLSICRESTDANALCAQEAHAGIRAVLDGTLATFSLDYPCHSPGQERWFTMSVTPFGQGRRQGAVISHIDISDRRQMENQIRQLAFHDTLTGLPNRRLFKDRLLQSMAASTRSGNYGAVMFLDLDNFKPLNDLHGHDAGDLLLVEVAERLRACLRETDTAARFGGDEFVVTINDLGIDRAEASAQAANIAEKIRSALAAPYLLSIANTGDAEQTLRHWCTVSIGIVLFVSHQQSVDEILKRADAAMYQAKEAGRNAIRIAAATA